MAPLIHLFTDFGWYGPYVGEMKTVLARDLPDARVLDLMHDAPVFNPRASAYLLAALSRRFVPGDICLAVVDPGVGDSSRRAITVEADGIFYVGPDNGLFAIVLQNARQVNVREIIWRPGTLSSSFHGRDLFAPIAAKLARQMEFESLNIEREATIGYDFPRQLSEIIYIDHYGNAVTGLVAKDYSDHSCFHVNKHLVEYAPTFCNVPNGALFWYANSMGLIEFAANRADAASLFDLSVGTQVSV